MRTQGPGVNSTRPCLVEFEKPPAGSVGNTPEADGGPQVPVATQMAERAAVAVVKSPASPTPSPGRQGWGRAPRPLTQGPFRVLAGPPPLANAFIGCFLRVPQLGLTRRLVHLGVTTL